MRIEVDTHVHTMLSGHSWSSLAECCIQAAKVGIKGLCITEHSAAAPNGPPEWLPVIMRAIPEQYEGVRVYRGIEADILDERGVLSPKDEYLACLDFCIASIHMFSAAAGDKTRCTEAYLNALVNPYVCALGHIDNPANPCDLSAVVREAKRRDKLIELNNSSLDPRRGKSPANFIKMMELCMRCGVRVSLGSDSHFHGSIGLFEPVFREMERMGFPPELVVNRSLGEFEAYIAGRRERLGPVTFEIV